MTHFKVHDNVLYVYQTMKEGTERMSKGEIVKIFTSPTSGGGKLSRATKDASPKHPICQIKNLKSAKNTWIKLEKVRCLLDDESTSASEDEGNQSSSSKTGKRASSEMGPEPAQPKKQKK